MELLLVTLLANIVVFTAEWYGWSRPIVSERRWFMKNAHIVSDWILKDSLPWLLFSSLSLVLVVVVLVAYVWGPDGFWKHVLERNLELHLAGACGLYYAFGAEIMLIEWIVRKCGGKYRISPEMLFLGPVLEIAVVSMTQEYVYSLMGASAGTWGGDWTYNNRNPVEQFKSIADNAVWLLGSMWTANTVFVMAPRNLMAKRELDQDMERMRERIRQLFRSR